MADDARKKRAAAMEEKKRRLEELKARRNRRGGDADGEVASARAAAGSNLNEYIDGLLSTAPPATTATEGTVETAAPPAAAPEAATSSEDATSRQEDNVVGVPAPAPMPPVKKVETFAMSTQTEEEDFPPASEQDEEEQPDAETPANDKDTAEADISENPQEQAAPQILSPEEMEQEVASKPFSSFLNTASKKVERLLGTPILADLLVDYVGETDGLESSEKTADTTRFLSARQVYECPKWTSTRDVTDMDWSPLHRELMLTSYHSSQASSSLAGSSAIKAVSPDDTPSASLAPRSGELQSDGLALVWSLAMPTRPEHIFTCGSPVMTARFHPTESPLVLGGCQSGQLVIWDVRAGRLPVQRSASSKSHVHPICSMQITEGGSGLVTAASDGKINVWSLANLRDPAESLRVDGNLSCLSVAPESNSLVCGDESGALHVVQAPAAGAARASKRPMRKLGVAKGDEEESSQQQQQHYGMVTAVATKSLKQSESREGLAKGFLRGPGGLILTAGVDWTVKLWAPAYTDKPLLNFVSHSYDYMCDVQWNPSHPSLFATASSNGSIGLWNLASSLEEPLTGYSPEGGIVVDADNGLNKLKWSADGRRMLVAAADRVHVLSMADDVLRQKGDESARMVKNLFARGLLESE